MTGLLFESETCPRCSGCGEYSYNQVHGKVCYGCNGKGVRLTKRGAAAQELYRKLLSRTPAELKVGDVVRHSTFQAGAMIRFWAPVVEASADGYTVEHAKLGRCSALTKNAVRVRGTDEEQKAALKKALALQESLT